MKNQWTYEYLPESDTIDFSKIEESDLLKDTIEAMRGCDQDKTFHPEGDVWTHTKMCLEYLVKMPE